MAIASVLDIANLDKGYVLAPERYDPRRREANDDGPCLADIVKVLRQQTDGKTGEGRRFLVFDTGDAHDGIIKAAKPPCDGSAIRSAKKRIRPHQVIISRLRPYLRQVAWVDPGLLEGEAEGTELLCSTEFFVLESENEASIAFLVPFLLSARVQSVLAASQEGGHHPRFNERTLKTLPVPGSLFERRAEFSEQFEQAVNQARQAFGMIRDSISAIPPSFDEEGQGSVTACPHES